MKISDLAGTPPAALVAQRARVAAIRAGNSMTPQPKPAPVAASGPVPDAAFEQQQAAPTRSDRPAPGTVCVLQFDAPLEFIRLEFQVAEVSVDETSITTLFRHDFRLHLGDLKPRLKLVVHGATYDVAYLGGVFQIPSMGLRGMTFVRILPEQ